MTHRYRHPNSPACDTPQGRSGAAKPQRYPRSARSSNRALSVQAAAGLAGILLAAAGCVEAFLPTVPSGYDSPDPKQRLDAIVASSGTPDSAAIPGLIDALDAPDPVARLLAITELRRRTGETLGYDHAADPADRQTGVAAWRAWWKQEQPARPPSSVTERE